MTAVSHLQLCKKGMATCPSFRLRLLLQLLQHCLLLLLLRRQRSLCMQIAWRAAGSEAGAMALAATAAAMLGMLGKHISRCLWAGSCG
jgi:hypothetical protein